MAEKLAVEMWAEKRDGRTRVIVQVAGEQAMELLSWSDGYDKLGLTSDPPKEIEAIDAGP